MFEALSSHVKLFDALSSHVRLFDALSSHVRLFDALSSHVRQCLMLYQVTYTCIHSLLQSTVGV